MATPRPELLFSITPDLALAALFASKSDPNPTATDLFAKLPFTPELVVCVWNIATANLYKQFPNGAFVIDQVDVFEDGQIHTDASRLVLEPSDASVSAAT
jgi:hypothetical protein